MEDSILLAILIGMLQGIFEWLPISSEGNISIVVTALGASPQAAINYALFLHLGTALAATTYFRGEIRSYLHELTMLRVKSYDTTELRFIILATVVSGLTGILAYKLLIEAVSALDGGVLIIIIGILLLLTGVFQWWSGGRTTTTQVTAPVLDAIIVGIGQGISILPGVSRSGTTIGLLLLRGYEGEASFRLSFVLSIPAAVGAALLAVFESGGLPGISPLAAVAALVASGVVGLVSVDVLMRVARSVAFWVICLVLGGLTIIGGGLTIL